MIKSENSVKGNVSKSSQTKNVYRILLQKLKLNKKNDYEILPLTFFSYNNNEVTLRIPAKLALQILEPKIAEWLIFYLQERR